MHNTQASIRVLRPKQACAKLGIGRTKLYEIIRDGKLKVIQLGPRSVGLLEHELDALITARVR